MNTTYQEQLTEILRALWFNGATNGYKTSGEEKDLLAILDDDNKMIAAAQAVITALNAEEKEKGMSRAYNQGWVDCQHPLSGDANEDELDAMILSLENDAAKLTTFQFKAKHGGDFRQALKRRIGEHLADLRHRFGVK